MQNEIFYGKFHPNYNLIGVKWKGKSMEKQRIEERCFKVLIDQYSLIVRYGKMFGYSEVTRDERNVLTGIIKTMIMLLVIDTDECSRIRETIYDFMTALIKES